MSEMGKAMMGTGEASGENRAIEAADSAINNPLLDETSMKGAKAILINITGGSDMTLFEVDEAANRIRKEIDPNANIIFGSALDNNIDGSIRVSLVATGISKIEQSSSSNSEVHNLFENSEKATKELIEGEEYQISDINTKEPNKTKDDSFLNINETSPDEKDKIETNESGFYKNSEASNEENIPNTKNELEIKEIISNSDNLELGLNEKIEESNQKDTFIPKMSSDVSEIDNTENFSLKLESFSKESNGPKDETPSIINRISGFWSKKSDAQSTNPFKEPILKDNSINKPLLNQTQVTDNVSTLDNNENLKDLKINIDEEEDKVLEIPAFLRRQVN